MKTRNFAPKKITLAVCTFAGTKSLHTTSDEKSPNLFDFFSRRNGSKKQVWNKKSLAKVLTKNEYQKKLTRKGPILSFETNYYNANDPIEDRHCECFLEKNDGYFFSVIDGHSGWHCAESLRLRLPLYLSVGLLSQKERSSISLSNENSIEYMGSSVREDIPTFTYSENYSTKQETLKTGIEEFRTQANTITEKLSLDDRIRYSYLSLDRDITVEAIPDGTCNEPLLAGLSGAVTVGAYIKDRDLYVANTGDCRAVLGFRNESGEWSCKPLSHDHTADNVQEVRRLHTTHPNEQKTVIMHQRLLGQLQPLRSFGDVYYKWSKELHRNVLDKVYGHILVPKSIYLTPPYLTAQPDVTHKELDENDGFLILATDGLWDTISSDSAVQMIGQHLDSIENDEAPEFNGATKLLRYSLGRNDENMLKETLSIPIKHRRNFHDDITVTVVYFNHSHIRDLCSSKVKSKL